MGKNISLRRLIYPVAALILLTISLFIVFLFYAANKSDQASVTHERNILSSRISDLSHNISLLAEDNAWWEAAYQNIVVKEDPLWLDTTISESVRAFDTIDAAIFLRDDLSVLEYEAPIGLEGFPTAHDFMNAGLENYVKDKKITAFDSPNSFKSLLTVNNRLYLIGGSLVQSTEYDDPTIVYPLKAPMIIFITAINDARLTDFSNRLSLTNLSFAATPPTSESAVTLTTASGEHAYLMWDAKKPGFELLKTTVMPFATMMIIIMLGFLYFMRQANALFRDLNNANRTKSSFLASMSHEIRTPLNAILGFSEMMMTNTVKKEKHQEYLEIINTSGQHLLSLINDILDLSKLEAGEVQLYPVEVNIQEEMDISIATLSNTLSQKGIKLNCTCQEAHFTHDSRAIRQIILNILSNACKFSSENSSIDMVGKLEDDYYHLTIQDYGLGMSSEEVETALKVFGQIQDAYIRDHTGTGLGLPIVKHLMEITGGKFKLNSIKNEGTTVHLYFNLNKE